MRNRPFDFICCGFFVLCFLSVIISSPAHADKMADSWLAANKVEAPSYILMDLDSGRILAQKNAHQRREPASTTKMMTCLVAIESGKLYQSFTVDSLPPKTGESSMYLEQGEVFPLYQLVQGALIKSANDACVAIAEAVAGNMPAFVHLMNLRAQSLGAHDTHFTDPHGLHSPQHYTSAHDLAIIARAALKYPFFAATVRTKKITLHGNKKIPVRVFENHNRLLIHWDKCDGVKTGYTRQAGRCLVATATETDPATGHRWRLLSVVMHAPNSWSDSINLLQHHGFDAFHPVRVAKAGTVLAQTTVEGSAGTVSAVTANDVWLPLRSDEKGHLKMKVHVLTREMPIEKGEIVAYVAWSANGHDVAAVPLVADGPVHLPITQRVLSVLTAKVPVYKSIWVWAVLVLLGFFAAFRVNAGNRKRAAQTRKKR